MSRNYHPSFMLVGAFSVVLFLTSCHSTQKAQDDNSRKFLQDQMTESGIYRPHVLIIFYDEKTGSESLLKAAKKYGSEIIYQYRTMHGVALRVPEKKDIHEAMNYYKKVKGVLSVSRDRINHLHKTNTPQLQTN